MIHSVGITQNGKVVKIDLTGSVAGKYVSRDPRFLSLAREVLPGMDLENNNPVVTYDMGRVIGYDTVVETNDLSAVFYAKTTKATRYTPFVKRGDLPPTQLITIVLHLDEEDSSYLIDEIWAGAAHPSLPGTTGKSSAVFWKNHAYIYLDQPVQKDTITKICPY